MTQKKDVSDAECNEEANDETPSPEHSNENTNTVSGQMVIEYPPTTNQSNHDNEATTENARVPKTPGGNLIEKKLSVTSLIKNKSAKGGKPTVLETHGYNIGATIGEGSYALVKVAYSQRHVCQVAVKIVSKFHAPSDYLQKFLPREIEVVKGLKHPNLIRFLQAIETTHRVYIVMEYAANGSLLDIIRKEKCIDEQRGRYWFRQLVDAIEYCHERGVVHRDIKCENLLLDNDYNIKVSDFGFARGHMRQRNGVVPLSETFCGSYAYASPEILKGIPYQPQMSDVWSMGVVLFATVFGRLPFDDSNYNNLLKQVQAKVVFPKEPKVSAPCKNLITRILAPLKHRLRVHAIRNDPWFNIPVTVPTVSATASINASTGQEPTDNTGVRSPVHSRAREPIIQVRMPDRQINRVSEAQQTSSQIQPSHSTPTDKSVSGK